MDSACSIKLQAYKSSFQAWKCVSFGYALLAIILLASKWHEVSTDLGLLTGIDKLLWAQVPALGANQTTIPSNQTLIGSIDAAGSDLLRREVDSFLGEFKSAESTLCLSSLLVIIYIVSWFLMTLAVNDTRISNDISLRNIVILSVFGAVDMAASVGFIMVRLIMFNVKNNAFMQEALASPGLSEVSARLSTDQLTAFAALRLIAMRSCSGYIDIYVSVIVALLTILRLCAIIRAIGYYRFLKRYNELSVAISFNHQQLQHRQQMFLSAGNFTAPNSGDEQPLVGYSPSESAATSAAGPKLTLGWQAANIQPGGPQERQVFRAGQSQTAGTFQQQQQLDQQQVARHTPTRDHIKLAPVVVMAPDGQHQADNNATFSNARQQQTTTTRNRRKLADIENLDVVDENNNKNSASTNFYDNDDCDNDVPHQQQAESATTNNTNSMRHPLPRRRQQQLHAELNHMLHERQQQQQQQSQRSRQQARTSLTVSRPQKLSASAGGELLLVNGRAHRLVMDTANESTAGGGFESEPTPGQPGSSMQDWWPGGRASEQQPQRAERKPAAAFTLLSAKQLDRLSRQLIAGASGQCSVGSVPRPNGPGNKHKLLGRYRSGQNIANSGAGAQGQPARTKRPQEHSVELRSGAGIAASAVAQALSSAGSCESSASDNDDDSAVRSNDDTHATSRPRQLPMTTGLRQTDELVQQHQQQKQQLKSRREMLLDKYSHRQRFLLATSMPDKESEATATSAIGTNSEPTSADHFECC